MSQFFFRLDRLGRDAVYGLRSAVRPGDRLTTTAVLLIVALAIATTASVFSVVDVLLIRGLPFANSDQLVSLELTTPHDRISRMFGQAADLGVYNAWQRDASGVVDLAGFQVETVTLTGVPDARHLQAVGITWNTPDLLGVGPLYGRVFRAADDVRGTSPAVLLSFPIWTELFGADPTVIGRPVAINKKTCQIVGIMPRGFHVPLSIPEARQREPEIWLPLATVQELSSSAVDEMAPIEVIGRVRGGLSLAAVQGQLDPITQRVVDSRPAPRSGGRADVVRAITLREAMTRSIKRPLLIVIAATVLLVILASVNLTNLLLARTLARERELATRIAIGASPAALIMQLVTEATLLTLVGAGIGLVLADVALAKLLELSTLYVPDIRPIGIDTRVAAVSIGVAIAIGIAVSAWPALTVLRRSPVEAMTARASNTRPATRRWMRALMGVEIAVAVLLLTSLGLLGRSFYHLTTLDRGYEIHGVVTAAFSLPRQQYPTAQARRAFWLGLLNELRSESRLRSPSISSGLPVVGGTVAPVSDRGSAGTPTRSRMAVWSVTPGYFETVGVSVLQGAAPSFDSSSREIAMDATAARQLFGSQSALGRGVVWGSAGDEGTVAAVVSDIQDVSVDVATNAKYRAARPHVYVGLGQDPPAVVRVAARTNTGAANAVMAIREAIARLDRSLPLAETDTLESLISVQLGRERFLFAILGVLAGIAVLLATSGIFAVVAHSTAQRQHEIGVRLAMGAQRSGIVLLILGESLRVIALGAAVGVSVGFLGAAMARSMLFETSPFDPVTLTSVVALITITGLSASAIPALRATTLSIITTLRDR
jgi:putative ABC transport system permease protein